MKDSVFFALRFGVKNGQLMDSWCRFLALSYGFEVEGLSNEFGFDFLGFTFVIYRKENENRAKLVKR